MKAAIEYSKIQEFSEQSGISLKKIFKLVELLSLSESGIQNSELIRSTGLSKQSINLFEKAFTHFFNPNVNGIISFNIKGKDLYQTLKTHQYINELKFSRDELNFIEFALEQRPGAQRDFDQFYADLETPIKRAKYMSSNFDLQNKKVLFIGDDDFGSIVAAITKLPSQITALEIDKNLLNVIKKISEKNKLNIQTVEYDALKKLEPKFYNAFDIVFIDPPYTESGVNLFLSRAIDALKQTNNCAKIYLNFGASDLARERYIGIQEIINKSGLYIRSINDNFSHYYGAESIGSHSTLYELERTPKTKAMISGSFSGKIYTND